MQKVRGVDPKISKRRRKGDMGSVKDLKVVKEPTADSLGIGRFTFSDRYSVFDWGEMPDQIPDKGTALAMMTGYNFFEMRKEAVESHFISMYSENRTDTDDFDIERPSDSMYVYLTQVLPTDNDYLEYQNDYQHYLIPLEVIFRNGAPKGSSLFKRLEEARGDQQKFDAVLDSMNLSKEPDPGDMFINPVYDFTTKLESTDRAITYNEAQQMAGLDDWEFDKLLDLARLTNEFITQKAEAAGFEHFDGKIEAMYNKTEILLVDAVGTFDENRFMYQDEQISKEILRQAYKSFQPDWVKAASEAKTEAAEKNDPDWKSYCDLQPKPLPEDFVTLMSNIYKSGANKYIGSEVFSGAPSLNDLIPELRKQMEMLSK